MEEHKRSATTSGKCLVSNPTSLEIFTMPLYKNNPVTPEMHNFYLDLSQQGDEEMQVEEGNAPSMRKLKEEVVIDETRD